MRFLTDPPHSGLGFAEQSATPYSIQIVGISVLLAWLYDWTGGSLLLTALAHAAINSWPMLWGAAVLAVAGDTRAIPFQVLITAATVLAAVLVVLRTNSMPHARSR